MRLDLVDWNNNGAIDLLVGNYSGSVTLYEGYRFAFTQTSPLPSGQQSPAVEQRPIPELSGPGRNFAQFDHEHSRHQPDFRWHLYPLDEFPHRSPSNSTASRSAHKPTLAHPPRSAAATKRGKPIKPQRRADRRDSALFVSSASIASLRLSKPSTNPSTPPNRSCHLPSAICHCSRVAKAARASASIFFPASNEVACRQQRSAAVSPFPFPHFHDFEFVSDSGFCASDFPLPPSPLLPTHCPLFKRPRPEIESDSAWVPMPKLS